MFNIYNYDNKISINNTKEIYNILMENMFITYPDKIKDRDNIDNEVNFNKWYNTISNTKDYFIIEYIIDNKVAGFLNYAIINNELWISEVQIKNSFKRQGILKILIKEFINKIGHKYNEIYAHINHQNILSKEVFTKIGFQMIEDTIYKINYDVLIKWLEK